MVYLGQRVIDSIVYVPFNTFAANGASVTISGFAVTDIKVYKDGSTTQRSVENGYTLLDTDGVDFDGLTGLHGFQIDLSDNTDAGFYAANHHYMVAVSAFTADAQTVSFWAASFDIIASFATVAEIADGVYDEALSGHTTAGTGGKALTDLLTGVIVNSIGADVITATSIQANAITDAKVAADVTIASVTGAVGSVTGNVGGNVGGSVASVTAGVQVASMNSNVITAASIAANAITDAKVAADVTIAQVTGSVGSVAGNVDGNVGGTVATVLGNVNGSVGGSVGSVSGNVGGNLVGSIGSLTAQAKADVNAEVVDTLNVDTYAEPGQGTPAATASLVTKIGYLYKNWRNRKAQTATLFSLYNDDAVTVDQKATVADDATTASKTEIATGP